MKNLSRFTLVFLLGNLVVGGSVWAGQTDEEREAAAKKIQAAVRKSQEQSLLGEKKDPPCQACATRKDGAELNSGDPSESHKKPTSTGAK